MMPALYQSLGVYLPLITTNCAVLGVALLSVQNNYGVLASTVNGIGASLGFLLAIVLIPVFVRNLKIVTFRAY